MSGEGLIEKFNIPKGVKVSIHCKGELEGKDIEKVNEKEERYFESPRCEECNFSLVDSTQGMCNCGKYRW